MKKFMQDNKKLFFVSVLLLMFVTACASVRDSNGQIIESMLITLETPFTTSVSESWFNIFVWPVAQLINLIAEYSDAGIGIIAVTFLLNFGMAAVSIKQQVATQKMQALQPEIQRIQAKYAGKTDQNSRLKQGAEMQAIYKKHDINPFGSIITMLLQLPIIFSVYQAVMRAEAVVEGTFLGIDLTLTPMDSITKFGEHSIAIISIFVLMIIFQFLSLKIPQYLQSRRKKKQNIKTKDYANPNKKENPMGNSLNMMTYMSVIMIAFLSINWPVGMSFYWMVSAFTRIIQNIVIQKFFIKDM